MEAILEYLKQIRSVKEVSYLSIIITALWRRQQDKIAKDSVSKYKAGSLKMASSQVSNFQGG